jgi:predicted nucleotidyltransferase
MVDNPHFKELLQIFNANKVEYLIVGGYAVMKYTEPRFTKDLDLWVSTSQENSNRVYRSLAQFGAPLIQDGLTPEDFTSDSFTYQIGVAPFRVDVLTHIDGVCFAEAWVRRVEGAFFGIPVPFIALEDLIANKRQVGRASDLEHLKYLQRDKQ